MHVETVNVGKVREVQVGDRRITTAIWKHPVSGPVAVEGLNVRGDDQADRTVHGGPDKAVYAYALEDTAWWENELRRGLGPGAFGENLSLRGVDVTQARIGERWAAGSTLLEVRQPRLPCFKLGLRHSDPFLPRRFARAGRPGAYLGIIEPGAVSAGDRLEIVDRPDHDVTAALVAHVFLHDHSRSHELLAATALPSEWLAWAHETAVVARMHTQRRGGPA
ncbi:MAG: MOSC domain-containing protein [Solirubrobacterales bacterium]|nr:MOSC domain-containing protein [Solirubrobacterales bacterium]